MKFSNSVQLIVLSVFIAVCDFLVIYFAFFFSSILRFKIDNFGAIINNESMLKISYTSFSLVTAVIWVLVLFFLRTYKFNIYNAGIIWTEKVLFSAIFMFGLVSFVTYYLRIDYSRILFLIVFPVVFLFLVIFHSAFRILIRIIRKRANLFLKQTVMIHGGANIKNSINEKIKKAHNIFGYRIVKEIIIDEKVLDEISCVIKNKEIDTIIVTDTSKNDITLIRDIRWMLEEQKIDLILDSNLRIITGNRIELSSLFNIPLLHINIEQFSGVKYFVKRVLDILFSVIILVLASPILLTVAILIKLEDGGPISFTQTRIGKNMKEFKIHKFRSMVIDAEKKKSDLFENSDGKTPILFKVKDDPRITKIGKFIRKTSLDEFLQFWDVILGNMSVVGPRPQVKDEVDSYNDIYKRRLKVKPGITGPWQVGGRSSLSQEQSEALDVDYVENWSNYGDMLIVIQTIKEVFFHKDAF